jgi:phage-related protein
MPMNFLGLGFLFGARDKGLSPTLDKVQTQLTNVNGVFEDLQETAKTGLATDKIVEATSALEGLKDAAMGSIQGGSVVGALNDQVDELQRKTRGGGIADALDVGSDLQGGVFDDYIQGVRGAGEATKDTAKSTKGGATAFGQLANMVLAGSGKISAGLGWIGLLIGPVISGFGSIAEAADSMMERVTGIPERIGAGLNRLATDHIELTNSLEGEATALNQSARQIGTNLGYTGANFQRFTRQATGMAMGLNIGAEEAGNAIYGWDEAAAALGATGLRSAQDLARLSAGLGINSVELSNATVALQHMGMSADQVGQLTRSFAEMGTGVADVSGALQQIPGMMETLTRRRAMGDTPEQVQQFAVETAAAARAMYAFGNTSDQAMSMAQELGTAITEAGDQFQGMFAGVQDQLPDFITNLSAVSGDVDESFRLMQSGPGGLIEGLYRLVETTRTQGGDVAGLMQFMRQRLQGTLGGATDTVMALFQAMESGSVTGVPELIASVRSGGRSLREIADQAFSTGRTTQEMFDRMVEQYQTSFRSLGRGTGTRFLRSVREALNSLTDATRDAVREGGPLGTVLQAAARADIIGPLSLLPDHMQGTAIAAHQLAGNIGTLANAFLSWGGIVDTVLNYVALFATEVMTTREETESWGAAISRVAQEWAGYAVEWLGQAETFLVQLADGFANFNWDSLFGGEGSRSGIMGALRRVLDRIGDMPWGRIWDNVQRGFSQLFDRLRPWFEEKWEQIKDVVGRTVVEWFREINWDDVWLDVRTLAGALWDAVRPALVRMGEDALTWLSDNWTTLLTDGIMIAVGAVLALLAIAGVAILAAIAAPFVASVFIIIGWVTRIYDYFSGLGDDIRVVTQMVTNDISDYFEGLGDDLHEIWTFVAANFRDVWEDVTGWFRRTWDRVSRWFGSSLRSTTSSINQAGRSWVSIFTSVGEAITTTFAGAWSGVQALGSSAVVAISERWSTFTASLSSIWSRVTEGWGTFMSGVSTALEDLVTIPDRLQGAWSSIVGFFRRIFGGIREAMGGDLANAGALFDRLASVATTALNLIIGTAEENHEHSIHTIVGRDMALTEEVMTETANNVSDVMQRVLYEATVTSIVEGFNEGFLRVSENMEDFSVDLTRQFEHLADNISDIMTDLFVMTVQQAETSMLAVETSVEGIVANLRSITAAQEQLARTQETRLATPADEAAYQARVAALENNAVLLAVNNPLWWSASGVGYRDLFDARMRELIDAVRASARAGGGGGGGGTDQAETVRLLREAIAAIQRGQRTAPTGRGGAGQPRVRRP